MMLRNRDLNVQRREDDQQQPKQQQRKWTWTASQQGLKRQAAHFIANNRQEEAPPTKPAANDEPMPKRTCKGLATTTSSSSTAIFSEFSKAIYLDSTKKAAAPATRSTTRSSLIQQRQEQQQQPFDFDLENAKQPAAVSDYVMDIFNYHKSRERFFRVDDYISGKKQIHVTGHVRAQLVNWLVDLQETFELNHETLYLAVKLFDMFMDRVRRSVQHKELQLVASVACWIAAKYDEKTAPLIDDFQYMAMDSFNREQMVTMEWEVLRTVDFNMGSPLSYRFLRRFARVSHSDLTTLALARYALEMSLMSLHLCRKSESLMAAASLLLARRMKGSADAKFLGIVQQCSGYTIAQLEPLMWELNKMLIQRKEQFAGSDNVFNKYSHELFFEVAKIPPLQQQEPLQVHRTAGRRPGTRSSTNLSG